MQVEDTEGNLVARFEGTELVALEFDGEDLSAERFEYDGDTLVVWDQDRQEKIFSTRLDLDQLVDSRFRLLAVDGMKAERGVLERLLRAESRIPSAPSALDRAAEVRQMSRELRAQKRAIERQLKELTQRLRELEAFESEGTESEGTESEGTESEGTESEGTESGGAGSEGSDSEAHEPEGYESAPEGTLRYWEGPDR